MEMTEGKLVMREWNGQSSTEVGMASGGALAPRASPAVAV
jgi:hypothetical protein